MGVRLWLLLAFSPALAWSQAEPEPSWRGPWKGLPELASILRSVPEGERILQMAARKDKEFLARVKPGDASYTESTFARSYSLLDGSEQIELKHEITLSRKLPLSDAVVDFAHELIHFTEKDMLDPYRPGFGLKEFVKRGIEGQGGELHALEQECMVAWALKRRYPGFPQHRLCGPYQSPTGGFDREKARKDYFALGSWYERAPASLKKELPEVSDRRVVFTSSFARKPYPIALAEEFEATRKAACANNRRKYRLISAQAESGRAPASELLQKEKSRLKAYERLYCQQEESRP